MFYIVICCYICIVSLILGDATTLMVLVNVNNNLNLLVLMKIM